MSDLLPTSSLYPLKSEIRLDIRKQILPRRKRSICVVKILFNGGYFENTKIIIIIVQ
jgi:hypothetical protein